MIKLTKSIAMNGKLYPAGQHENLPDEVVEYAQSKKILIEDKPEKPEKPSGSGTQSRKK